MRLGLMILRMEVLEKSAAKGAFRFRTQPQVGHILKALCKCAPGIQTKRIQKRADNFKRERERESHILCGQNRSFGKKNFFNNFINILDKILYYSNITWENMFLLRGNMFSHLTHTPRRTYTHTTVIQLSHRHTLIGRWTYIHSAQT